MAVRNRNKKLFGRYITKTKSLFTDETAREALTHLSEGQNSYMRMDRVESSSFDLSWIKKIEDCLFDLGDIITNPREVTASVANLVPVELARKTNAESVRHLASHTQYIKTIDEHGQVIPSKILNIANETDIHTYENRFIATLVRRLVIFVEKRYEFVKAFAPLHDEEILYFKSKAIIGGEEVEVETKVKVRSNAENAVAQSSNSYIERIKNIREYVLYYYNSNFMRTMKTDHDVRAPIVMTNILRKNPKYHKCYELFNFIQRYENLGVAYKVNEDVFDYNEKELKELNMVMFANYLALKSKDKKNKLKTKNRVYKPKLLKSLEDEPFIYDELLKGPVEYVRVDEPYQQYLNSLVKEDLPVRPTKLEKEYYKEEIEQKKKNKEEQTEKEKLAKRKEKEQRVWEKKVQNIIAKRQKEEAEAERKRLEDIRLAEEQRIEEERQKLIETAKTDEFEIPEEPVIEEKPAETPADETNSPIEATSEPLTEENEVVEEPSEKASTEENEVSPIEESEELSSDEDEESPVEEDEEPEEPNDEDDSDEDKSEEENDEDDSEELLDEEKKEEGGKAD